MPTKRKPLTIQSYRLPTQLVKAVDAESQRTGLSKGEIVRRAIDAYLKRK